MFLRMGFEAWAMRVIFARRWPEQESEKVAWTLLVAPYFTPDGNPRNVYFDKPLMHSLLGCMLLFDEDCFVRILNNKSEHQLRRRIRTVIRHNIGDTENVDADTVSKVLRKCEWMTRNSTNIQKAGRRALRESEQLRHQKPDWNQYFEIFVSIKWRCNFIESMPRARLEACRGS